jgi:hypothetical protein
VHIRKTVERCSKVVWYKSECSKYSISFF